MAEKRIHVKTYNVASVYGRRHGVTKMISNTSSGPIPSRVVSMENLEDEELVSQSPRRLGIRSRENCEAQLVDGDRPSSIQYGQEHPVR